MTSEPKLIDIAARVVTDEEVLAAGVLQPRGSIEGMSAGLAADTVGDLTGGGIAADAAGFAALGAGQAAAKVEEVPRWTMVAVTPTRVHLLSVRSTYLLHVRDPEPLAVIERTNLAVTRSSLGGLYHYALTDCGSGRQFRLECSRVGSLAHGNEVMELLEADEPEPEPRG